MSNAVGPKVSLYTMWYALIIFQYIHPVSPPSLLSFIDGKSSLLIFFSNSTIWIERESFFGFSSILINNMSSLLRFAHCLAIQLH